MRMVEQIAKDVTNVTEAQQKSDKKTNDIGQAATDLKRAVNVKMSFCTTQVVGLKRKFDEAFPSKSTPQTKPTVDSRKVHFNLTPQGKQMKNTGTKESDELV